MNDVITEAAPAQSRTSIREAPGRDRQRRRAARLLAGGALTVLAALVGAGAWGHAEQSAARARHARRETRRCGPCAHDRRQGGRRAADDRAAGDAAGIRQRDPLCPRDRLYRQAQRRYRLARVQGRRAGGDRGAGPRPAACAGEGAAGADARGAGAGPGERRSRPRDRGAHVAAGEGRLAEQAARRHGPAEPRRPGRGRGRGAGQSRRAGGAGQPPAATDRVRARGGTLQRRHHQPRRSTSAAW